MLCPEERTPGTIEHMLATCSALEDKRITLNKYIEEQTEDNPVLAAVVASEMSASIQTRVQFLLDPSARPSVQKSIQNKSFTVDDIFAITRTYCYAVHTGCSAGNDIIFWLIPQAAKHLENKFRWQTFTESIAFGYQVFQKLHMDFFNFLHSSVFVT